MLEYGWPAAFDETVEERIVETIDNLMRKNNPFGRAERIW